MPNPMPASEGAYFSGSTVGLPDDAELSASSDIDIVVVTAQEDPPAKLGKLRSGALLEASYLSWTELASADDVLASCHLAGSFRTDAIIDDPTGDLYKLHAHISRHFAARPWARRRCQDARRRIETRLVAIDASAPFHEPVASWLFPTGVTCHVLLVAALRNPTVRLRYPAAREVLTDSGHLSLYPALLNLLGCSHLPAQRVQHHLRELAATFDTTVQVGIPRSLSAATSRPQHGRSRLTEARGSSTQATTARPSSGSSATFARCHSILAADAPQLHEALAPAFQAAVADLGINSTRDLIHRAEEVTRFLPRLWKTTEDILNSNPNIAE
jgi:hypothetical protein